MQALISSLIETIIILMAPFTLLVVVIHYNVLSYHLPQITHFLYRIFSVLNNLLFLFCLAINFILFFCVVLILIDVQCDCGELLQDLLAAPVPGEVCSARSE